MFRTAQAASWETQNLNATIESQFWDVMDAAHSLVNGSTLSTYHAQMLQRVRRHIAENLGDPDLCPSAIADATGIGLRQLNRLFQAEPLSLMEHIQSKRLEGARLDLLRRNQFGDSVSEISYRWGFKSLSHFSRKFRGRFGVSPSQF
ncbi:helix-turn-helix domain-containing protein [Rhizobium sp. TH2]|uniref:helix-turn-helix domain-containing protein n=1 Tax=Rhizobium sp. TH2 TaxID=2775403 RepID=UPI00215856F5|nr:helix-turn-helix domain-containing protein [Rhizobium sp. TH2]